MKFTLNSTSQSKMAQREREGGSERERDRERERVSAIATVAVRQCNEMHTGNVRCKSSNNCNLRCGRCSSCLSIRLSLPSSSGNQMSWTFEPRHGYIMLHTHIHTLLNTQKKVQCIVTIRSLWADEAYYLCIDFKRFQRFQSIQALKYWSLSETVVVGAIPHRWLSARLRAKAYRFVKREKETWAKSCTYSTILRVPEAIIFYEDSHLSPIQSKSNAPIHCKSNTRLSFASIFLASICVGCWVLLCLVLRTKDF